ncbi:MAG: hypothetical protein R3C05_00040 [Pirellulaceae bacterium]
MTRTILLSTGLLLTAFQWTAFGQARLQFPIWVAQNETSQSDQTVEPVLLPSTEQPLPDAPQVPSVLSDHNREEGTAFQAESAAHHAPSEAPVRLDFDTILSDGEACASVATPTCETCGECAGHTCEECEPCCLAAFVGRDPCVPVPPIGVDPLYAASFEDIYRTPDCCRGLWANYPAEKRKEGLHLRRSTVPPAPCTDCGPQLYKPICEPLACRQEEQADCGPQLYDAIYHPSNKPRRVICPEHDQRGFEPNCPYCQQARAQQTGTLR